MPSNEDAARPTIYGPVVEQNPGTITATYNFAEQAYDVCGLPNPYLGYPWGRIAALQQADGVGVEDMFVIGQQHGDESLSADWRLYDYCWNGITPSLDQMIGGATHVAYPETGVAAIRRATVLLSRCLRSANPMVMAGLVFRWWHRWAGRHGRTCGNCDASDNARATALPRLCSHQSHRRHR